MTSPQANSPRILFPTSILHTTENTSHHVHFSATTTTAAAQSLRNPYAFRPPSQQTYSSTQQKERGGDQKIEKRNFAIRNDDPCRRDHQVAQSSTTIPSPTVFFQSERRQQHLEPRRPQSARRPCPPHASLHRQHPPHYCPYVFSTILHHQQHISSTVQESKKGSFLSGGSTATEPSTMMMTKNRDHSIKKMNRPMSARPPSTLASSETEKWKMKLTRTNYSKKAVDCFLEQEQEVDLSHNSPPTTNEVTISLPCGEVEIQEEIHEATPLQRQQLIEGINDHLVGVDPVVQFSSNPDTTYNNKVDHATTMREVDRQKIRTADQQMEVQYDTTAVKEGTPVLEVMTTADVKGPPATHKPLDTSHITATTNASPDNNMLCASSSMAFSMSFSTAAKVLREVADVALGTAKLKQLLVLQEGDDLSLSIEELASRGVPIHKVNTHLKKVKKFIDRIFAQRRLRSVIQDLRKRKEMKLLTSNIPISYHEGEVQGMQQDFHCFLTKPITIIKSKRHQAKSPSNKHNGIRVDDGAQNETSMVAPRETDPAEKEKNLEEEKIEINNDEDEGDGGGVEFRIAPLDTTSVLLHQLLQIDTSMFRLLVFHQRSEKVDEFFNSSSSLLSSCEKREEGQTPFSCREFFISTESIMLELQRQNLAKGEETGQKEEKKDVKGVKNASNSAHMMIYEIPCLCYPIELNNAGENNTERRGHHQQQNPQHYRLQFHSLDAPIVSSFLFQCISRRLLKCSKILRHATKQFLLRKTFRILHFNDVYHLEAVAAGEGSATGAVVGGASRFLTKIRELQERENQPLILFSGDFVGPSLTSVLMKGRQMIDALNMIGVHVGCLGNHELDYGLQSLKNCLHGSDYQGFVFAGSHTRWVMSNVKETETKQPLAGIESHCLLMWNGVRIGLLGLAENWLPSCSQLQKGEAYYEDMFEIGEKLARKLKEVEGAECVIALTHSRLKNDKLLAEKCPSIDLILGGHDHFYKSLPSHRLVKSGSEFEWLSELEVVMDRRWNDDDDHTNNTTPRSEKTEARNLLLPSPAPPCEASQEVPHRSRVIVHYSLVTHPIVKAIPQHEGMEKLIDIYQQRVKGKMGKVIGTSSESLDCTEATCRFREGLLSGFFCDIMVRETGSDFAILGGAAIAGKCVKPPGDVTIGDVFNWFPNDTRIMKVKLQGSTIQKMLNVMVRDVPNEAPSFPHPSSELHFAINLLKFPAKVDGVRIKALRMEEEKWYTVAVEDFVGKGQGPYKFIPIEGQILTDEECAEEITLWVINYFEQKKGVRQAITSRRTELLRAAVKAGVFARVSVPSESEQKAKISEKIAKGAKGKLNMSISGMENLADERFCEYLLTAKSMQQIKKSSLLNFDDLNDIARQLLRLQSLEGKRTLSTIYHQAHESLKVLLECDDIIFYHYHRTRHQMWYRPEKKLNRKKGKNKKKENGPSNKEDDDDDSDVQYLESVDGIFGQTFWGRRIITMTNNSGEDGDPITADVTMNEVNEMVDNNEEEGAQTLNVHSILSCPVMWNCGATKQQDDEEEDRRKEGNTEIFEAPVTDTTTEVLAVCQAVTYKKELETPLQKNSQVGDDDNNNDDGSFGRKAMYKMMFYLFQLSIHIHEAMIQEELQEHEHRHQKLLDSVRELISMEITDGSSLNLNQKIYKVSQLATKILQGERALLYIHDPESNSIWTAKKVGKEKFIREQKKYHDGGTLSAVLKDQEVINVRSKKKEKKISNDDDDENDEDRATFLRRPRAASMAFYPEEFALGGILAVPVFHPSSSSSSTPQGQVIGALAVFNKVGGRPCFSRSDEQLATIFAKFIAIFVHSAKEIEALRTGVGEREQLQRFPVHPLNRILFKRGWGSVKARLKYIISPVFQQKLKDGGDGVVEN